MSSKGLWRFERCYLNILYSEYLKHHGYRIYVDYDYLFKYYLEDKFIINNNLFEDENYLA